MDGCFGLESGTYVFRFSQDIYQGWPMSYQVLARKWRPKTFPAMVGQEHVLRALINALDNDRLHHAYLFTGTRGVGKTTVARIFAKSLNCEQGIGSNPCGVCSACREIDEGRFVDLIEVDAASRTKVEDTRELLENVQYAPTRGRYKVYLIDEVHMLSTHSFNALLKTLEEPPPHVKFLLATTDPQKLPVTILSRCLQFNLKRMAPEMIVNHLDYVLSEEGIEYEKPALLQIAEGADGSMRDALSLLDQAIAYGAGRLTDAEVRAMLGTIDRSYVFKVLQGLADQDSATVLDIVNGLAQQGIDFTAVLGELISVLHKVALAQVMPSADEASSDHEIVLSLAQRMAPEDVQLYYQIGLIGRRDLPLAPDLRSGFEMILLRMMAFRPDGSAQQPQQVPVAAHTQRIAGQQSAPRSRPAAVAGAQVAASATVPAQGPVSAPQPQMAPVAGGGEWHEIVEQLGLTGMVYQLAANATLESKEGAVVKLAQSAQNAVMRSKSVEQRLQDALQNYYGEPIRLEFVATQGAEFTPAARQQKAAEDRQQAAVDAIQGDPNVQRIQQTFDGQVVPDSVRPVDS